MLGLARFLTGHRQVSVHGPGLEDPCPKRLISDISFNLYKSLVLTHNYVGVRKRGKEMKLYQVCSLTTMKLN